MKNRVHVKLFLSLQSRSFSYVEGSAHDSIEDVARILGKEGTDACFTFKVDVLIDAEGIGEVK